MPPLAVRFLSGRIENAALPIQIHTAPQAQKSLPLWGRWPSKARPEEVPPLLGEVDRRSLAGGVKRRLSTPQSKIFDF